MKATQEEIYRGIKDFCREENFDYTTFPGYIEVHHPNGGARVAINGTVESALNPRLKKKLQRRVVAVEAIACGDTEAPELAYVRVIEFLDILNDDELASLQRIIRQKQLDRETEQMEAQNGY